MGTSVTLTGAEVPVQPLASVTVRVTDWSVLTTMLWLVSPVLHKLPDVKFEERVTLDP